jgi:hypothetical protein
MAPMNTPPGAPGPARKVYRVYVLRLWRAEAPGLGWQASLEDQRGCERIGFASLEQLFAFLMEQAERDSDDSAEH